MSDEIVYLWLDLETTGLDASSDLVLEAAWHFTDIDLVPLSWPWGQEFVRTDIDEYIEIFGMHADVIDMHEKSGLFEALREGAGVRSVTDIETQILDVIAPGVTVQLSGSGVHFDRAFIDELMPRLSERLHYRFGVDVSTIKRFFENAGLPFDGPEAPHRALADVELALDTARYYRNLLEELKQ